MVHKAVAGTRTFMLTSILGVLSVYIASQTSQIFLSITLVRISRGLSAQNIVTSAIAGLVSNGATVEGLINLATSTNLSPSIAGTATLSMKVT